MTKNNKHIKAHANSTNTNEKENSLQKIKEYWNNPFLNFCKYAFYVYFLIALLLSTIGLIFFQHKNLIELTKFNWLFFLIAIVVTSVIGWICWKLKLYKDKAGNCVNSTYKKTLIIGSIILIAIMFFICFGRLFIAGWDVWYLFFDSKESSNYFSLYPNNLFLKGLHNITLNFIIAPLYSWVVSAFPALGSKLNSVSAQAINYAFFVLINVVCVYFTILLATLIIKKAISEKASIFAFVVSSIFIGMMPWIAVPYSDITAMAFTTVILWSYICVNNTKVKISLITAATIIGYFIKPTIIFVTISILIISIVQLIWGLRKLQGFKTKIKKSFKNIILNVLCVAIASIVCICCVNITKNNANVEVNEDMQFTSTHFLMMGLNTEKEGLWAGEDVALSGSCTTVEEREHENIQTIIQRLQEMGPEGFISLMAKKTMCNYADGNFSWELDAGPNFYSSIITNNELIDFVYKNYRPIAQVFWFSILIAALISVFVSKKVKNIANVLIVVICITLAIQSVFLMLFECGARYLILYLPFFVILATFGWTYFPFDILRKKN